MRKLEITLTEEQYQHIQQEIKYGGRTMLEEETLGGFEITLHVGVPNIYTYLEMNYTNLILKCRTENEVAFLFYDAAIDLHSHSYGNYEQENRAENERV